jgi:hypothetical protein
MTRLPNQMLKAVRRDHWNQQVRSHAVKEGRAQRDMETRRMEEYRRLCKKEGIVSKRLEEYDQVKEHNKEALQQSLDAIDTDTRMTNAQKKRRKFALKRKVAGMSSAMQPLKARQPMERLIRKQEEAEKQKVAAQEEKKQRVEERETRIAVRRDNQKLYQMKTKKGQPLMRSRMECLMKKISKT